MLRSLLAPAVVLLLLAGAARADVPPRPPGPRPSDPAAPAPKERACGVGMALVVFGLGVLAAWRLSKPRPAGRTEGAA